MKSFLILCLISTIFSKVVFDLETVRADLLARHNLYRSKHQADNLARLTALEDIAQAYSEKLVTLGYLVHSSNTLNGNYIGENLYFGYNAGYLGTTPVDAWYNEIVDYDFEAATFTSGTGHFTQVVWKNTKQMGCGFACSNNYCTITCNYYPAGNYVGEFAKNVLPLTDDTENEETNSEDTNSDETNSDETNTNEQSSSDNTDETADSELTQFRQDIVSWHNYYRALHQVGDLEEDS